MIIRLTTATTPDITHIGGKACGLVRLLDAGLEVPHAWVIPASASLDPAARTELLDRELTRWWNRTQRAFPGSTWAVRSSAVAEDLADASFAGVYETVLGVDSAAALRAAVLRCWQALHANRAVTYHDNNLTARDASGGIALILQRMLVPRCAGVMLTANPMRPFAPELCIDAAWGLGEAVVSGRTEPDHVVVDLDDDSIQSYTIGAKAIEYKWDGRTIAVSTVDPDRAQRRCLTDDDVHRMTELARRIADRIGPRRDVEWAIEDDTIYLLQDRPITALPPARPDVVHTRALGDEYLTGCGRPLQIELVTPWLVDTMFGGLAT